jgi:hypothetical protein
MCDRRRNVDVAWIAMLDMPVCANQCDRHTFRELIVISTSVMFTVTHHCTRLRSRQVQQLDRMRAFVGNDKFV